MGLVLVVRSFLLIVVVGLCSLTLGAGRRRVVEHAEERLGRVAGLSVDSRGVLGEQSVDVLQCDAGHDVRARGRGR